ncbi:MAG: Arm DNA-binding domain-containing protein [Nitrococcus sp.]|nr:Arm DNA-binding domain-containing protein [Nitrococcus sp.]
MPLTDTAIRDAKPAKKPYKKFDGKGLFALLHPNGGKYWRLKYYFTGKEKAPLALGVYPDVSLKDARERRDEARKLLANGVDPAAQRKAQKAARTESASNSFEVVARRLEPCFDLQMSQV